MIDFTNMKIGQEYDRPTLAKLWGYESHHAISRGVFTPKDQNIIVFFITRDKQQSLTQYEDHIDMDTLFWEGEKEHGNDKRIISGKDSIHVFYREIHHSSFVYRGRAFLQYYRLYEDRPSKFVFELVDSKISEKEIVAEIQADYGMPETEKESLVVSRIGQGLFRKRSIDLWHSCSVTGFSKENVLVASHIKPWKLSDNSERLNPYNSLLLVPTLDKLFDKGYIGFEPTGRIMLSEKIQNDDWKRININPDLRLKFFPVETKKYLDYHREYIFDLIEK